MVVLPVLTGCQPKYGGDSGAALAIPGDSKVRVVTTPIETKSGKLHYKWSLIGGVNWRKAAASGTDFTLADTYPLNSVKERGGCNVFEMDLRADTASGKYKATLHGSDGSTANTEGDLPPGGVDGIRIEYDTATKSFGLPTQVTFARIGDKPLRLQVAR